LNAAIQTPRLSLVPLALAQLELCLTNLPALESELCLPISDDVLTARVQGAIRKKIEKMSAKDEARHPWQTYWLVVITGNNVGAGLVGFKGYPDESGSSEIGYGIDPAYQNKGYMSEAVQALVEWALEHPICKRVTATAVENPASSRLLEKLGAHLLTENGSASSWEFTR
jgi:[ribosomal protein S5]-alanine N-acetyltransferase